MSSAEGSEGFSKLQEERNGDEIDVESSAGASAYINPEYEVNLLSRITFWFVNQLVVLGKKRPLNQEDLWYMDPRDSCRELGAQFDRGWNKAAQRKKPGLLRTLHYAYGTYFYLSAIFKLLHDVLQFVNPVLLRYLIAFVADTSEPGWHGWFYAFALFLSATLQSIFVHQYFNRTFRSGMHVQTGVIDAVYRKTLRISTLARQEKGAGNIVNLMSNDAQKLKDTLTYLHSLWSAPLQIAISIVMLFNVIGWPSLVGLAVMVVTLPLNSMVAKRLASLRTQRMVRTDERVKWTTEMLNSLKGVKLYAWEEKFISKLFGIRNGELQWTRKTVYWMAFTMFLSSLTPIVVGLFTFMTYTLAGYELTAETAFVTISLMGILRFPLLMIPMLVGFLSDAKVALNRLDDFFQLPELDTGAVERLHSPYVTTDQNSTSIENHDVLVENGNFCWDPTNSSSSTTGSLTDINLLVPRGKLTVVVGAVGSGKSSLLAAILGEMPKLSGRVALCGKVAYVAQEAWIQNMSLRDNVLFGSPYQEDRYVDTIHSCALTADLLQINGGDRCEIGERGINLSGGQKQRVNLARAIYSDSDVFIMDDCLSAVDSHVGRHIFNECFKGVLRGRTIVLATHQLQFLPDADRIIVMKDGSIDKQGTYSELLQQGVDFSAMATEEEPEEEEESQVESAPSSAPVSSVSQFPQVVSRQRTASTKSNTSHQSQKEASSSVLLTSRDLARNAIYQAGKESASLTTTEERETGSVQLKVYKSFASAAGPFILSILLILFALFCQTLVSGQTYFLSYWSDHAATNPDQNHFYLAVYSIIGLSAGFMLLFRGLFFGVLGIRAAKHLHEKLVRAVVRAPMSFIDQTPVGRFVSRFTKDTDVIDSQMPGTYNNYISILLVNLGGYVLITLVTPWFLLVLVVLMFIYWRIQQYYMNTSRELKRLQSISRSPIFVNFSETLSGLPVIRAYQCQSRFLLEDQHRVDENNRAYWALMASNRWLGLRLEFVGNLIVLFVAMFSVVFRYTVPASLVGLALSNALQVTGSLSWLVRMNTELEMAMNSVERVLHYINVKSEADLIIPNNRPPAEWPHEGVVEFHNFGVRYRPDLPLILNDVTCQIHGSEKVGIVGRTGAGKSTFVQSLFRLVEASEGSLSIDGIDISQIGLHDLRSKISIVPQDPLLFSGTVRFNLDPFDQFSDRDILDALDRVSLTELVQKMGDGLASRITEGGGNLSVGERQLFCMARAILRKTKIVVMDEATANIDTRTDSLLQSAIREAFADCTVLTIAHRLNTVIDADRIMVLERGSIVEFDAPAKLLKNTNGKLYSMVQETGDETARYLIETANQAYRRSRSKTRL